MELIIDSVGGLCPCQGEGTVDGYEFYFRARHGAWTFNISLDPNHDAVAASLGRCERFHREGDDPTGGYMEPEVARRIIQQCAEEFHETLTRPRS
jgi:hypothetical protein